MKRLQSLNFSASVATILLMAVKLIFDFFNVQGVDTTLDPQQVADGILSKNWEFISQVAIPGVWVMILKLVTNIKNGTFSWSALWSSPNFLTAAITLVIVILNGVGFAIAETAAPEIAEAIASGSFASIIVAILINIANPLWHFIQDWLAKIKENKAKTVNG